MQEHHREENHNEGDRRDQHGQRHFPRAVECGLHPTFAHTQVAGNVVEHDYRLVHEDADRQRKPSERHAVDRIARIE